jgi:hypothetical protein
MTKNLETFKELYSDHKRMEKESHFYITRNYFNAKSEGILCSALNILSQKEIHLFLLFADEIDESMRKKE